MTFINILFPELSAAEAKCKELESQLQHGKILQFST